jgi:IclR family transcriptional regulator, KDG regulon repressor
MRTLNRTIKLIEKLATQGSCTLTDLSNHSELPKSTVFRFLESLLERGWVTVDEFDEGKTYRLGPAFLALCNRAIANTDLIREARPYLTALRDGSAESSNLGVLQGSEVICLDSVASLQPLRMNLEIGERFPIHATAMGKAIAAFLPTDHLAKLLDGLSLQRMTAHTSVELKDFEARLQLVREQGYALDDMEHSDQVRCVAVPVFGAQGVVVAGMSISGPISRISKERLDELVALARSNRDALSVKLGYRGSDGRERQE